MEIVDTIFEEVKVYIPKAFEDSRGYFSETYNYETFKKAGLTTAFIQDNQSLSVPSGTIRGLHYQVNPNPQAKLVRVLRGSIFDVVVDIRKGSPTCGKWFGVELSADNRKQLFVPHGFAHGFCTLEKNTEVTYKVDGYYAPECERGIIWNDEEIGIEWPVDKPLLSAKDALLPPLKKAELFMTAKVEESV